MIEIFKKSDQAYGEFNNGDIIENKPIGFPGENNSLKAYSNLFYWAHATAKVDSTIGLHPHKGFEIMTFVLDGEIKHYDTLIEKWIDLKEGDIQLIQSGSGISHSEHMQKDSSIFQIWFDPDISKTIQQKANYQDFKSDNFIEKNNITKLVGKSCPIEVESENIEVFRLSIEEKFKMDIEPAYFYSIYLISGDASINSKLLEKDDFIKIYDEKTIEFNANKKCEFFIIKSPQETSYKTYI